MGLLVHNAKDKTQWDPSAGKQEPVPQTQQQGFFWGGNAVLMVSVNDWAYGEVQHTWSEVRRATRKQALMARQILVMMPKMSRKCWQIRTNATNTAAATPNRRPANIERLA